MRKRWLLLALPLAIPAALPLYLPMLAAREGVEVQRAFWCKQGLCMEKLVRGSMQVESAVYAWDRSLTLNRPVVQRGNGGGGASGGGLPSGVRELRVRELRVEGLPVSLPPLSGTVLPERHLRGTNIEIDGDTVTASLLSEWGPIHLQVRHGEKLAIEAFCAPCSYQNDALSEDPLELEEVTVSGTLEETAFVGTVRTGGLTVEVQVARPEKMPESLEDLKVQGTFRLATTPVQAVYQALRSVVPEANRATFRGTIAAEGSFAWPGPVLEVRPTLEGFAVNGLVDESYARGRFRFDARNANGEPIVVETGEGSPGWTPLAELGAWLPQAVVAAEDTTFWKHPGYDLPGMLEAAKANQEAGEIQKGGSTITQQLAKNLFLDGRRTYARKLRELLYTVEIERELGKSRILEIYLNVIEWGWNVRGALPASRTYFFKSPQGLLPEEAAWLAGIIREPKTAWKEQYQAQHPSQSRIRHILLNMVALPPEERAAALARPVHLVPPE